MRIIAELCHGSPTAPRPRKSTCPDNSAIDVFVTYDGKRAGDIVASRFAVRQLVAQAVSRSCLGQPDRQMDAEVARRRGQAGDSTATSTAEALAEQYGAAKTGAKATTDEPAAVPTDFFGRVRLPPAAVGKSGTDQQGTTGE